MTQRIEKKIEQDLDQRAVEAILMEHYKKKFASGEGEEMKSLEITEFAILPKGLIIKIRGLAMIVDKTPDKIFAPPTRS